jgi:hypothetical protein
MEIVSRRLAVQIGYAVITDFVDVIPHFALNEAKAAGIGCVLMRARHLSKQHNEFCLVNQLRMLA